MVFASLRRYAADMPAPKPDNTAAPPGDPSTEGLTAAGMLATGKFRKRQQISFGRKSSSGIPAIAQLREQKADDSQEAEMLGKVIRKQRKAKKLTQEQLAERSGLSTNYVGNVERGEYDITVKVLQRLAKALECEASALLEAAELTHTTNTFLR